jgi:hypothetical protein
MSSATFLGSGKADELARIAREHGATLVLVRNDLSVAQSERLASLQKAGTLLAHPQTRESFFDPHGYWHRATDRIGLLMRPQDNDGTLSGQS